ncbi:MAG: HlyC/CorC family transporter, partial [Actinomyces graevenitzii]|nr:HlyC/CorC family transporter [Actinomyces graevenitzii]
MHQAPVAILLAICAALLLLGMLLSASETALIRITKASAEDLVQAGRRRGKSVAFLADNRRQMLLILSGVRVVVDMSSAVLLTVAVSSLASAWWQVLLIALACGALVLGFIVGISPKSLARRRPEAVLLFSSPVLIQIYRLCAPLRWWHQNYGHQAKLTEAEQRAEVTDDLREMIDEIGETDSIEAADRQMMRQVVELGQTLVREIMVPRPDMVTIDCQDSVEDAFDLFVRSGYSRIPVIGSDADDVRGLLYLKDLVRRRQQDPTIVNQDVAGLVREATYYPETNAADDVLRQMQREHVHMVLLVDEYGGTAGLVTMEDLVEEVVGELTDEHDHREPEVENLGNGVWRV